MHDQCAHLLVQYEEAEAHVISFQFKNKAEHREFEQLVKTTDPVNALRGMGRVDEARRVVINTITMAIVSDCLHHLYEALRCAEKRKFVVTFNLLRKPMTDSLLYLSWILADEDSFYESFSMGDPAKIAPKIVGNFRKEIIAKAMAKTNIEGVLDSNFVNDSIFDAKTAYGFYRAFQHAVHLVTAERVEIRTSPENFNFIFKSPFEDDTYEAIYELLPSLLLYLSHVMLELFDLMKPMDRGAKTAFQTRSVLGLHLLDGGHRAQSAIDTLKQLITSPLPCEVCQAPFCLTHHNAARVVLSESFRCTKCRRIQYFPFSYAFD